MRIYDELSAYGPLTASGLADRLGESSGATSYHLRQLERTGLVREDTTRGKGRERWWERTPGLDRDPRRPLAAARQRRASRGEARRGRVVPIARAELPRVRRRRASRCSATEWLDIATSDTINLRLTPEQLSGLVADIDVVLMKYIDAYKRTPTPGSRPVQIQINAFPLVRGEATEDTPKG